jgi:hypothetical protein
MIPEYEFEPVKGLPYRLPEGERILWQGSPRWLTLAKHLCHIRFVTAYFVALIAYAIYAANAEGLSPAATLKAVAWLSAMTGVVVGLLAAFAYAVGRTTIYTITNKRVVLRYGVALNKAVNIPFKTIESAGLRSFQDGSGDIALQLAGDDKIAFLILWPHTRPWYFKRPQPMMRGVNDANSAVEVLRDALVAYGAAETSSLMPKTGAKTGRQEEVTLPGRAPLAA